MQEKLHLPRLHQYFQLLEISQIMQWEDLTLTKIWPILGLNFSRTGYFGSQNCYFFKLQGIKYQFLPSWHWQLLMPILSIFEYFSTLIIWNLWKMFIVGNTVKNQRPPQQRVKFVIVSKWEKCKLLKRQKELSYNFISSSWFQWCMEWRTNYGHRWNLEISKGFHSWT